MVVSLSPQTFSSTFDPTRSATQSCNWRTLLTTSIVLLPPALL